MAKRISYMMPVRAISGNISGRQDLEYTPDGGHAYDAPDDVKTAANNYAPRLIACVRRDGLLYYKVRTRTSATMSATNRLNLAALGGAGALFSSLLRNKTAAIYNDCYTAFSAQKLYCTFREFMINKLRRGLKNKSSMISIDGNVEIVNPWVSSDTPNVIISNEILDKFSNVLSINQ